MHHKSSRRNHIILFITGSRMYKSIVKRYGHHFSRCHSGLLKIHGSVFHKRAICDILHAQAASSPFLIMGDVCRDLWGCTEWKERVGHIVVASPIKAKDQQSEQEETCKVDIVGKSGTVSLVSSVLGYSVLLIPAGFRGSDMDRVIQLLCFQTLRF